MALELQSEPGRASHHVQILTSLTLDALHQAALTDVIDMVTRRVLSLAPAQLYEITWVEDERRLTYKPMIELLLRELRSVARMPHASREHRRARIGHAMMLAGV